MWTALDQSSNQNTAELSHIQSFKLGQDELAYIHKHEAHPFSVQWVWEI
jgi:hypothetical protein